MNEHQILMLYRELETAEVALDEASKQVFCVDDTTLKRLVYNARELVTVLADIVKNYEATDNVE